MPVARKDVTPIFRSAFESPDDEYNTNLGVRPVVFDILAPDQETSVLPEDLKMVLHVNPTSMSFSYEKVIERIQTKGGYVEQHWGDGARSISFSMVTGGFKRLYSGLSNVTGGGYNTEGTRRETIAYDKYLDILALFHNNGSVYDTNGQIVFQGVIKVTFDGGIYLGWFSSFNVSEAAERPYQFELSADFTISHEVLRLRSFISPPAPFTQPAGQRWLSSDNDNPVLEAPTQPTGTNSPGAKSVVQEEPDNKKPTDPTYTKKRRRRPRKPKKEAQDPTPAPVTPPKTKKKTTPGWTKEFTTAPPSRKTGVAGAGFLGVSF